MLNGIKSLLGSEKAITGGVLVICATVLVGIGVMTVVDWQTYTRDIFITYASAKTVQGAVAMWTDTKKAPSVATATPATADAPKDSVVAPA